MNTSVFEQFFADCVGKWHSDRTYHYLTHKEIERSQTTFHVDPLTSEQKIKVLTRSMNRLGLKASKIRLNMLNLKAETML